MNSERKIKRSALVFVLVAFFCTASAVVLRIVNILKFYDADIGYFKRSPLPITMNIWFIASIVAFLTLNIVFEKKQQLPKEISHPAYFKICSAVSAIATLSVALYSASLSELTSLVAVLIFAAVISAVYFAMHLLKKLPEITAILALFPALICVLILGATYFDPYVQMNSPHKVLIHVTCVACMLGFLAEARLIADKRRKRSYPFYIASALFFCATASIPSSVLYFSDSFDYAYIEYDLFFLAFFIYFAARMVTICLPIGRKQEAPQNATEDATDDTDR